MTNANWKKIRNIVAIIGIAIQFGMMCYYEWAYFYSYVYSDIASDLYLADTLARSGHWLLTKDWLWSSEIHFLHNQLLMVPLFHIFDSYRMVLTFSFAIGVFLCIVLCIWITFQLCEDFALSVLSAGLLIAPISVQYEIGFMAMASWPYIFFTLLFWGLYLCWRKRHNKMILASILILSVLMGMCGIRFFMIVFAPYFLAVVWKFFANNMFRKHIQIQKEEMLECGVIMAASVFGYGLYHFLLCPVYGGGSASAAFLVESTEVAENVLYTPFALLEGLGGFRMRNEIASSHGIAQLAIIFAIILIYAVWIFSYKKSGECLNRYNEDLTFARSFMTWALLLNCFLVGFTNMGQIWGRPMECHYIMLALIVLTCVVCAIIKQSKVNYLFKMAWIGMMVIYIIAADLWYFRDGQNTQIPEYVYWLNSQDYEYGVSATWDYGMATTAYTDGAVEVDYVSGNISDEGQMTRKSNSEREPEFFIFGVEWLDESEINSILVKSGYSFEMVYEDTKVSIYELN